MILGFTEEGAHIGEGTAVWRGAHIREGARVGDECVIGAGVYIGPGVVVGDRSKVQNNALIYEPAILGRGVFVGPGVVFTNDKYPRAVNPDLTLKGGEDWEPVGVRVESGASIGAGAVCVAPVRIGAWAMVAAGSVVTRDVPAFTLVAGNPAVVVGRVDRDGRRA